MTADETDDELIKDATGKVVAVGQTMPEYTKPSPESADRRAARESLIATAKQCAPALVGLKTSAAQAAVDAIPGLWIRFAGADRRGVDAMFGVGRLTAWVRNDVVTRIDLG